MAKKSHNKRFINPGMYLVNYLCPFTYPLCNIPEIHLSWERANVEQTFYAMKAWWNNASGENWFLKYKLYHIPFWMLYHYTWWVVTIGNAVKATSSIFFSVFAVKFGIYVIFQAFAAYFNLYFLIPKYLETGRYRLYLLFLFITILCTSVCIVPAYYLTAFLLHQPVQAVFGKDSCFFSFFTNALSSTFASTTLAMSIKLTKNWIQSKRRQQLLEKEKLETELKFLKYQFNPHFLFNSINSIFFLIHKNPDMASASLAKFSDLLRHQLYESNDQQIPLSKEVTYLENFIELEKLRQNSNMEVAFQVTGQHTGHLSIAPFILMTFVENAFKHVSKHTHALNWIRIALAHDQQRVYFTVANSTSSDASNEVVHYGGIGLQNVRRRLDLIYPGQYELDIQNNGISFHVELRLQLAEPVMPAPVQKQPDAAFVVSH
jgi:two-component system, LytTR family, sensor kinase